MEQHDLFPETTRSASDEEVVAAFRIAVSRGGRLPRLAELYLATVCAEHLVEELHAAVLAVVRPSPGLLCD
jgi:hypothetical protein